MFGFDYGLSPGGRLCQRPSSESNSMFLEPRQGEPEGSDKSEIDSCRLLYRNILCQAVHDMGFGREVERDSIREFCNTEWFETICDYSRWDHEWIRKIMAAVDDLDEDVRREITTQVVHMLKEYFGSPEGGHSFRPHGRYASRFWDEE